VTSFRWVSIVHVKEIITPFKVVSSNTASSSGLHSTIDGTNDSSVSQPVTVTFNSSHAQTVTVATMDQNVDGVSSTFSPSESADVQDITSSTATWSVSPNYSYTHSDTRRNSETQTIALSISQTVNALPASSYTATLLVHIGEIPPTVYDTTAQRWNKDPVIGAQLDPANNNLYKRVKPVKVTITGSLASRAMVNVHATPLSNSKAA
jgi:hypothetical protein